MSAAMSSMPMASMPMMNGAMPAMPMAMMMPMSCRMTCEMTEQGMMCMMMPGEGTTMDMMKDMMDQMVRHEAAERGAH